MKIRGCVTALLAALLSAQTGFAEVADAPAASTAPSRPPSIDRGIEDYSVESACCKVYGS